MAVDMRERGTVGCCYYVARTEKLHLMEDVKFGSAEIVDMCELMRSAGQCATDSASSEAFRKSYDDLGAFDDRRDCLEWS